ncbi:MAG: signal peptidase I [Bacilli bacterium]|nr:signal peptidase I [Bacilli bacterium]
MEENSKMKKFIKEYLPYILVIILVVLIKRYIVSPVKVNGTSMIDTLHHGDIMILNSSAYYFNDIERFDIVVVDEGKEYIIKRVIGLPGETVEYRNNKLYINGKFVKDNYASKKTDDFKYKVGKNSYFVLGDNRTNSMDSRVFGAFKKNKIIGKTSLIVFPFNRFGTKK